MSSNTDMRLKDDPETFFRYMAPIGIKASLQQSGTWYTYGIDLPKNITEVYAQNGYISTAYTYTPYGLFTASGDVTQPIQWSSEYADTDLDLVYYNYRHYNPLDGRWTGRDPQENFYPLFLYDYCFNNPVNYIDIKGKSGFCQDYLWFGGTCINNSSHDEYALYDSKWYLLKPGQSTPNNKDCDGMTCGGKYYAVKGITAFDSNTATCEDSGLKTGSAIVEWDGKDNSSGNRNSPVGSGASDLPPNMK